MKKITITFTILFAVVLTVSAQTATTTFTAGGITVIYKPTQKQIINVSVYFRGGVNNYPANKAGIENLAIASVSECGTAKYSKDAFKDKADSYGIAVYGSAGRDNALIGLNCISQYFNTGWDLLAQAVTTPSFDEGEFNKLKQKVISGIKQSASSPDARLSDMAMQNAFAGTPYAINPAGTEETAGSIKAAEAKDYYYNTLLNKTRMFIVVVGNISKADITAKIIAAFANVPAKPYQPDALQIPVFKGNTLTVEERQLATNYITGIMNGPAYTSADYVPYRLAFASLSDKLFTEIRTKRNLSYAPQAYARGGAIPYSAVYVTTTNPKAAVEVMANEIDSLKTMGFTEKDLKNSKALFITSNYMKDESTNAIAASLGTAETLGNWKIAESLPVIINNTTQTQMTDAFRKYIMGIKWNYLGIKKQADEAADAFNIPVAK